MPVDYESFSDQPHLIEMLTDTLRFANINPGRVQLGVDLACGNGAGASAMVQFGIPRERVIGIDVNPPRKPLVRGIRWEQIDLDQLYIDVFIEKLRTYDRYKGKADIVFCLFNEINLLPDQVQKLCHWFAKKNGLVFVFP